MKPLIGISCCSKPFGQFAMPNHAASDTYVRAVDLLMDAVPVLLPANGDAAEIPTLLARLADAADAITTARFRALDLSVSRKPDRTPVTDADTAVEDAIRAILATERPGDAVAGEERGGTAGATGRAWVLDPIDGTKNFLRGVPVWATLRSLGRSGVIDLVDGLADAATGLAEGFRSVPGLEVLNDVVFTQVCLAAREDAATVALGEWLRAEGTVWASSSVWRGRAVVRFAVSNLGTDAEAVRRTIDAVTRGAKAVGITA